MKRISERKKLAAFVLAVLLFSTMFAFPSPVKIKTVEVKADTVRSVDEILADQLALEEEQDLLEEQIAALDADEEDATEYGELLEKKMNKIAKQIATANKDIKTLNGSINDLNDELDLAAEEYSDVFELFKERLSAIYKTGSVGTLEILFDAESFSDYMMKLELMQSVSEHDNLLMEQINEYMESTDEQRKELKKDKLAVADLKKTLEDKTDELNTLYTENEELLLSIAEERAAKQDSLDEGNAYADALYAEMEEAYALMARQEEEEETPEYSDPEEDEPTWEDIIDTNYSDPTPAPTEEPTPEPDNTEDSDTDEEDYSDDTELENPEDTNGDEDSDDYVETDDEPENTNEETDEGYEDESEEENSDDDSYGDEDEEDYQDNSDDNSDDNNEDDYQDNSEDDSTEDDYQDDSSTGNDGNIYFSWPCPGYSYISSPFGGYEGHYGLDMAASFGTPIYAAADGYVTMANDTDEWGYSWGYYVFIYHNDEYSTRYAHMSAVAVSTGDYVYQGQLIGYVGLTGNTTGPHLHFEVYQWGSRIDPGPFFY